jgi:hypothetical protein
MQNDPNVQISIEYLSIRRVFSRDYFKIMFFTQNTIFIDNPLCLSTFTINARSLVSF